MIKLNTKARYAIKNMAVKDSSDNRRLLWWMLWGMMVTSEHKDWMVISRYQDRYANFKRTIDGEKDNEM